MFDDDDLMDDGGDLLSDDDDGLLSGGSGTLSDAGEEESFDVENHYYSAKNLMKRSIEDAEKEFRKVIEMDQTNRSDYGFKSLKRIVKLMLSCTISLQPEQVVKDFTDMLSYSSIVGSSMMEKGVNSVLDAAVASKQEELMEELAQMGAEFFLKNKNERAWFRINLKLINTMIETGNTDLLAERLGRLVEWCELAPGYTNPEKADLMLEVLALQMQCAVSNSVTGKNGLRRLVSRASKIESDSYSRTLGTIHECSGKVMLYEHHWSQAKKEFFDAFKEYNESSNARRFSCLRYIVLAAILENSQINPFESPETKALSGHEEIIPSVLLWNAFEEKNVSEFISLLHKVFEKDEFAREFVPLVIRSFHQWKILELVNPYTRVRIPFVAKQLQINEAECEALIVELILDGRLPGSIDQTEMTLNIGQEGVSDTETKYNAMAQWSRHITEVSQSISSKVH